MGNLNLSQIRIDAYPEKKNNLVLSSGSPEKDKVAINTEKKKMKLLKDNNKDNKDSTLIEGCLSKHFFLCSLDRKERQDLVKGLSLYSVKPNVEIFRQGDTPGCMFILSQGTCDLIVNGEKKETLQKGSIFGDTSIIYGTNRDYTIKTTSECQVWLIDRDTFENAIDSILNSTYQDNYTNISKIPSFSVISPNQKTKILNNIYRESFTTNKPIFVKGDTSKCLYILKDGSVILKRDGKTIKNIGRGECFGALEILANSNRITDAIPSGKTTLYTIPTVCLKYLLGNNYRSVLALTLVKAAFASNPALKKLNLNFMDELFKVLNFKYYDKETEIIRKGEPKGNLIVLTIEGELVDGSNKTVCPRNNILFGKEVYEGDTSKTLTPIKCKPYSLLATIRTSDLKKVFKCTLKELGEKSNSIDQLKKVNLFKNLSNQKLEVLSRKIKIEKIPNGKNVITQGEEGTRFYIIKKGFVDIFVKDKYIRTMNENEYLGERALFFKEPRSATATAKGDVEVYYLEKQDFETVIEKNLKEYLKERLYLQDNRVELEDLIYYMVLGTGAFGNVCLVKSSKNKFFYAIKNISCKQILLSQLAANLNLEKSILLQIDHPFIVKLVKTLKDKNYVYFLMDYIKGKELFDVLRDINVLNKFQTQFYSASILLACNYLHERKIVYRDIKPENIMVVTNGFIKLIDFGTAKSIKDRTKTIIGTPDYMAPEVILGKGYSFSADYWSIAVMMYEFVCGKTPFGDGLEEPTDIYLAVINE